MEYPTIFDGRVGTYSTLRGRVLLLIVDFQIYTVKEENSRYNVLSLFVCHTSGSMVHEILNGKLFWCLLTLC